MNLLPVDMVSERETWSVMSRAMEESEHSHGMTQNTKLHQLICVGNNIDEIMEVVSEKGMEVDVKSLSDGTPLHRAAMEGHLQTAKILLQKGANPNARATGG